MESKASKDKKFDSIYRAYKDSIFKVAMHYTKCEDLASEITQRTFFQLYIYFENVDLESVYPWLITTARNSAFNYNRDRKREILAGVFDLFRGTKDRVCYINNMEEYYLRNEQKRRAECLEFRIFERLYKEHRIWYDAVMQVYCFGKSQQEAADQLGIAVEVLNSRLYRARQWIRKNYEKEYEEVVNRF